MKYYTGISFMITKPKHRRGDPHYIGKKGNLPKYKNKKIQRRVAEENYIRKIHETWKFDNTDFMKFLEIIEDNSGISLPEIFEKCRWKPKAGRRVSKDKIDFQLSPKDTLNLTRKQIQVFIDIALRKEIIKSKKEGERGGKICYYPHKSSPSAQIQNHLIISELESLDLELNEFEKIDYEFLRNHWFILFKLKNEFLKLPMKYHQVSEDFDKIISFTKERLENIDKIIESQKNYNNNAKKIMEYLEDLSAENDLAWLYAFSDIKLDSSTKKMLGEMDGWRQTTYNTLMYYLPKE